MNRKTYFDYIEEHLAVLSLRIENRGKLNVLDLNLHSENFYRDFLNLLYGWKLENLNKQNQNVEAIDLIDNVNKIIVQVSAKNTKQKIEDSLGKASMADYKGWFFKFISIAKPSKNLRKKSYNNPHGLLFSPKTDIYDIHSLLSEVDGLKIERMKEVENFIRKELGNEEKSRNIDSDLAKVITLLAQVDWSSYEPIKVDNDFQVDTKIDYNELVRSKDIIKEYSVYQNIIRRIYSTFDAEGVNKSFFVLHKIRSFYLQYKSQCKGDELFEKVRSSVRDEIKKNESSGDLSIESIDICSDVVVVDTFIRCKIFENPEGYSYVTT